MDTPLQQEFRKEFVTFSHQASPYPDDLRVPVEMIRGREPFLNQRYFQRAILMQHWGEDSITTHLHVIRDFNSPRTCSTTHPAHNILFRSQPQGFMLCRN